MCGNLRCRYQNSKGDCPFGETRPFPLDAECVERDEEVEKSFSDELWETVKEMRANGTFVLDL